MAKMRYENSYVTLEKLRAFTQKIHKFLYVKPIFLPQNSSILHENTKVENSDQVAVYLPTTFFKRFSPWQI